MAVALIASGTTYGGSSTTATGNFANITWFNGQQLAGDRAIIFIEHSAGSVSNVVVDAAWTTLVSIDNGLNGGLTIAYYDCAGGSIENNRVWTFSEASGNFGNIYSWLIRGSDLSAPPPYQASTSSTVSIAHVGGSFLDFMTYTHPLGATLTAPVAGCLPMVIGNLFTPYGSHNPLLYNAYQATGASSPWLVNDGTSDGLPSGPGDGHDVGWTYETLASGVMQTSGPTFSDRSYQFMFTTTGGTQFTHPFGVAEVPPTGSTTLLTAGQQIFLDINMPTDEVTSHTYYWTVILLLFRPAFSVPVGNNPFVAIDAVGGSPEYARASQPVGQKGLVQVTFTVPSTVTHVVARMDTNGCTIGAPILQFAQIKLEKNAIATSYMPGPEATVDGGVALQRFKAGTTTYT